MKSSDITEIGTTVVGVTLEIQNWPTQEPAVVNELLTREIISILKATSNLTDLDYIFFEGWKSRNGTAGFAVFGKDPEDKLIGYGPVLAVKFYSSNLYDTTNIPKRFLGKPGPTVASLNYGIEVSATSPLYPSLFGRAMGLTDTNTRLDELVAHLTKSLDVDARVLESEEFYEQFNGDFELPGGSFDEKVKQQLMEKDALENGGRYVRLVISGRKGTEFKQGHVIRVSDGRLAGLSTTGSRSIERNQEEGYLREQVIAVFGKGFESIYMAEKK